MVDAPNTNISFFPPFYHLKTKYNLYRTTKRLMFGLKIILTCRRTACFLQSLQSVHSWSGLLEMKPPFGIFSPDPSEFLQLSIRFDSLAHRIVTELPRILRISPNPLQVASHRVRLHASQTQAAIIRQQHRS